MFKKKICSINLEKKIAFAMFILGFIMMFMIPTWNTPDEYTHLNQIGRSIENENFATIIFEDIDIRIDRVLGNYDEKVDVSELKEALTSKPEYDKGDLMPKGITLSVVKHLPATIGILLGVLLGLPTFWVLQMAELFSLLFYVVTCYYALKIMPIKKETFAMVLLIPMALQQAGGIGYDSVLIPLCFCFIAYVFWLKMKETVELKNIIGLMVIWLIITYIKMPYCLLMLLIFIVPLDKIHIKIGKFEIKGATIKKYRILLCSIAIVAIIIGIYYLRNNFFISIVLGLLKEWRQTLFLLKETGRLFHEMMITSTVGNFGWLDTPIPYGIAISVFVIILITAMFNSDKKEESKLKKWDMLVIWGTVVLLCVFTTVALVNHTIMVFLYGSEWAEGTYDIQQALYQIPYIGGIQGRYYLPFVSLFFLPLPQIVQISKKKTWLVVSLLELAMFIYIMYVLMCRYWVS